MASSIFQGCISLLLTKSMIGTENYAEKNYEKYSVYQGMFIFISLNSDVYFQEKGSKTVKSWGYARFRQSWYNF